MLNQRLNGDDALAHALSKVPQVTLMFFWIIKMFATTLGTALGDMLTKPLAHGGFGLDRISSSLVILALMVAAITLNQRAEQRRALAVVTDRSR